MDLAWFWTLFAFGCFVASAKLSPLFLSTFYLQLKVEVFKLHLIEGYLEIRWLILNGWTRWTNLFSGHLWVEDRSIDPTSRKAGRSHGKPWNRSQSEFDGFNAMLNDLWPLHICVFFSCRLTFTNVQGECTKPEQGASSARTLLNVRPIVNNEILLTILLDVMQWRLGEVKP